MMDETLKNVHAEHYFNNFLLMLLSIPAFLSFKIQLRALWTKYGLIKYPVKILLDNYL